MADIRQAYGTASDVTITLASLASDTNLLAGRESAEIVNSSTLALDYLVSGKITSGTSPTASRQIEVWAVGSGDGTNWPDVFDGTESGETITSSDSKASVCRLVAVMATSATSDVAYHFGPVSIASAFGGVCPPKFVLFVTHNTAVALNATAGNHLIRLLPCFETVA
jgi:hypothetical protein